MNEVNVCMDIINIAADAATASSAIAGYITSILTPNPSSNIISVVS